jgi:cytochrome P450
VEDTVVPFPVGSPGTFFQKDDVVVCIGSLVHSDPAIYSNPGEFIAERFTADYKKGRTERGEKESSTTFLPFGGGVSMCEGERVFEWLPLEAPFLTSLRSEGRHFASAELRIAALSFLHYFDVEKVTPGPAQPDLAGRIGLGIVPVRGKCLLRLRRRDVAAA